MPMQQVHAGEISRQGVVRILSVGQPVEDRIFLQNVLRQSAWPLCPDFAWELVALPTLTAALAILRYGGIPIVVCGQDLGVGAWRQLLEDVARSPAPPCVIVTSRLADERLWAEALNLGAYDVLAHPLDREEVARILSQAWFHWNDSCRFPIAATAALRMASGM